MVQKIEKYDKITMSWGNAVGADVAEKPTLDIPMYVDILSNFCSNKIASKLKLVNPKPKGKFC